MRYAFGFLGAFALGLILSLASCFNDILSDLSEGPCSGIDCDDENICTRDYCVNVVDIFGAGGPTGPTCQHDPVHEGSSCTFEDISGVCRDGLCGAEGLCEGVVCNDRNLCTDDTCAWNGNCVFTPVGCSDGNPCTQDGCDRADGTCYHAPKPDGTSCMWWFNPGTCNGGVCVTE